MLARLKQSLNLNLEGLKPREIVALAEVFCSLDFNPDDLYQQSLSIVGEGPNLKRSLSQQEIHQAAKLYLDASSKANAYQDQIAVGEVLADIFQNGSGECQTSRDRWKAYKYRSKKTEPPKPHFMRTESIYPKLTWFTRVRLFLLRANRLPVLFNKDYAFYRGFDVHTSNSTFNNIINPITHNLTDWLSLSYFAELFVDVSLLVRAAIGTDKERIATPKMLDRVANTFFKDNRPKRMINAGIWGPINAACRYLPPPIAAAVNLIGFALDCLVEGFFGTLDIIKYNRSLRVIRRKKYQLEHKIHLAKKVNNVELIQQTRIDIAKYECIEKQIAKAKEVAVEKRNRALMVAGGILAGMALLFIPVVAPAIIPLFVSLLKVNGALMALSYGSLYGGFGKASYELIKQVFKSKPKVVEEKKSQPELPAEEKGFANPNQARDLQQQIIELQTIPNSQTNLITPQNISIAANEGRKRFAFFNQQSKSMPILHEKKPPKLKKNVSAPVLKNSIFDNDITVDWPLQKENRDTSIRPSESGITVMDWPPSPKLARM